MAALESPLNTVESRIDGLYEERTETPRHHLGASLLGHPCERFLWLSFRWAVREHHSGRMLRLFERGQLEELRFVKMLRGIGVNIRHTVADQDGQVRVNFGSFVSGSVDGIIESGVPGAEKTRHIAEFKTHNARSFAELKKKGVFDANRRHWCQMQVYMAGTNIDRALYLAVNKNDDELYSERVGFNPQAAHDIIERGKRIALSERIPPPLSENPAWWQCKTCPMYEFCHTSHCIKAEAISCRTCCKSTPHAESFFSCEWLGLRLRQDHSEDGELAGCAAHVLHPDLVPWTWKGGTNDGGAAVYVIDGKEYINGCGPDSLTSAQLLTGERVPEANQEGVPF